MEYFGGKSQTIAKRCSNLLPAAWGLCPPTPHQDQIKNVSDPTPIEIISCCRCLAIWGQSITSILYFLPFFPPV